MKIENIKLFLSVVNAGSMNKAAEQSFVSQQNLGLIIKKLENELGIELFIRDNTGCRLTEDGENFLPYAQQIVALYDDYFQQYLSKTKNAILNLHTTPALGQLFSSLQINLSGQYILSVFKHSNMELQQMIKNKMPGVYFFPLWNGQPEFISKLPDKYLVTQEDRCVMICHRDNPILHLSGNLEERLAQTINITDTYVMENTSNSININDLDVCKRLMKEKGFVHIIPFKLYRLNFSEEEWPVIKKHNDIKIEYVVLFYLPQTKEMRGFRKIFLEQLQSIFASL